MEIFKGVNGLYYLIGVLLAGIALEALIPWRRVAAIDFARWLRNASMTFYGVIILGLAPALSAYGAALAAQERALGLFNAYPIALWAQLFAALVVFDLLAYGEHRILHKWYFFWRGHRIHHADRHIDATTSLRFHPVETIFRAAFEIPFILLIGLPPEGVLFAFAVHVIVNTFTHSNVLLPLAAERVASALFITPRMHRLHHACAPDRQYSNFATMFSIWDRLFGTFSAPDRLRDDEAFGIDGPEQISADTFANLALDPFRKPKDAAVPKPKKPGALRQEGVADANS